MSKRRKSNKNNNTNFLLELVVVIIAVLTVYLYNNVNNAEAIQNTVTANSTKTNTVATNTVTANINIENIPEYADKEYIEINENKPYFEEKDYTTNAFENYSNLDEKKRCGVAYANICKEIMPKDGEKRGSISNVKPTGWEQTKVNGEYIYNRCHLIGYQLSAENANEKNLITGTRYFNVEGMLPFENQVAEYIQKNNKNHVLYRVTPVFKGDNLLATGVEMEAYSVEDQGKGLTYNVFVYNVQPGVELDYATGKVK